ncbi:MAG: efflux RND transporter periplasmic adaptor subunit [Planctomycetaceae bacterium]
MTLLVAAVTTVGGLTSASAQEKPSAEVVSVRAVVVGQDQVQRTITQPATIEPYYRAEIRSRLTEYVEEVCVDIGDSVAQGDILARLSIPEMQKQADVIAAKIGRLQAEERRAEAGVALATAAVTSARALLEQARSLVVARDAELKAIDAETSRVRDLVGRAAVEGRLLDEVTARRDAAAANRQAALSAVGSAEADTVVAQAKLKAAEADADVARAATDVTRAELAQLRVLMGFAELKAPFAGIVTKRTVNPGELVGSAAGSSSSASLFVVHQIDRVRCHISVPERDAAYVRPGDRIVLTFPSFSGEQIDAAVTRTSLSLDPETRTILVEAELPNPQNRLVPGMFGQAVLSIKSSATVSILPSQAVRFDGKGAAQVFVILDDSTVAVKSLQVLSDDGKTLQVSGVDPGQRVIDAHLQRFTDGQRVQVLNP